MPRQLAIFASGLVTAVGYNAPATLAALRGRISAVRETPWIDHESGEPIRGTRVSLPQWWYGVGMLADILAPAIHECLLRNRRGSIDDIPLFVGVSAVGRPGRPTGLDEELLNEVYARLNLNPDPRSRLFAYDQYGCARALIAADEMITRREARRIIVAGVDSYLHLDTLNAFLERRRLITPSNSNGFFPGEAGCAVLVGAAEDHDGERLSILGLGVGHEDASIESTKAFRATGMTRACQEALANAGIKLSDIAYRLTDLSGEHYKFKEAHFVAGRLDSASRTAPLDLWHPIEFLGEIGAAILPCLLAQAMHAGQEQYAPGPIALCHVGSDDGGRAAIIVQYE